MTVTAAPPPVDPQEAAKQRRRRIIVAVILVSLGIHFAGGIVAGVWIVARYLLTPPATFEVKKEIRIAAEEKQHRMNVAEFDAMTPKPTFQDKMATARPTDFALPDLPKMPVDALLTIDPTSMITDAVANLTGAAGTGSGGSGLGGSGGGGSAVNFFGISDVAKRVIIVVDVSDTMFDRQPGKFDTVKQQAKDLIRNLGINTLFNVIIYEGGSVAMFPAVQPATDANKEQALAWIDRVDGGRDKQQMSYRRTYSRWGTGLFEGGGTRTDTALKQALQMKPSTVFLISDGEMSRRGQGPDAEDDKSRSPGRGGNTDITEKELLDMIEGLQAGLPEPARIHVIHFVTGKARPEEEKKLRAISRRNSGKFRQVQASSL